MNTFLLAVFFVWRAGLFFVSWVSERIILFTPRFPYADIYLIPSKLPVWVWSFANFDGVHYLTIARQGYLAQFTQVFFPFYPFLLYLGSFIFPFLDQLIIGLLVSNGFFILSLHLLWRLLAFDYKKETIKWSILFLVFFPVSFFFGSLYTESLFLFLVLTSFYLARQKKWWLAGIFGGVASSVRLVGIFLLPALLWEWHKNTDQKLRFSNYYHKVLHFAFCTLRCPMLYLVPIGLLSYMIYLQLAYGDLLYFWHAQPVFGASRSGSSLVLLPQVVWRYLKIFSTVSIYQEMFWISLLEFCMIFMAITSLIKAYFAKVRLSYLIFSWLALLTPTFTGTFSSMPRYILVIFPLFIVLGSIQSRLMKTAFLAISSLLLVILTVLFTRGHWVS